MAKSELTESEILARIEDEERAAYGINDTELSKERAEAIADYLGDVSRYPAPLGRSQVVSYDTQDTIESALPQLLKIFVSGDQVVKFEPRGPEDIDAAEQETDYVNYLVMEKNPGFSIFYTWFKDAMLSKNGYVKAWYEEETETETETYTGLTDNQIAMMLQDDKVEVLEHTEYPDEQDAQSRMQAIQQLMQQDPQRAQQIAQMPPAMLHDVKISITETKGCIEIEPVAPENIMISSDTTTVSVQESRFVQHREMYSVDELREQGYDVPDDVDRESFFGFDQEQNARNLYGEVDDYRSSVNDMILVRDTYMRVDGELKRYVVAGNRILKEEDCEIIPFAVITPHIMPHRHIGRSYADLVKDVQGVKTALMRGQLDNMYLQNNGRYGISDKVNLDDFLTSRPGGAVRVDGIPGQHIMPFNHPALSPQSFSMVEYMDSIKEKRTGVTAYNQGLDSNSLNKTATGVNAIMGAAQERIALVARTFAETGVKELFMLVHRLVRKYVTKAEMARIRNEWVEVDPRTWKNRYDMSISVGLGTGNKDQQLMHLTTMYQMAVQDMAIGISTPENIYNIRRQLAINSGFKNPEEFLTNPSQQPPKEPQPDPKMQIAQMQLQADQQKFQAQAEIDQRQAEQAIVQEQLRSQNDLAIEKEKMAMQAALEKYKADLKAETDLVIARMKNEMDAQNVVLQSQIKDAEAQRAMSMDKNGKSMNETIQQVMQTVENLAQQIEGHSSGLKGSQITSIRRVKGPDGRLIGAVQIRADGSETPIQIQ